MAKMLICFFSLLSIFSCRQKDAEKNPSPSISQADEKENMLQIMEADKSFSNLSMEKGMKNAFIEYMDSNGILLRPDQHPIVGADAIDYLSQLNDSGYVLQWEPSEAIVAQSGDLGFTYGIYTLTPTAKDTVLKGTYVSIWRKQKNGSWKFLLDSGNEGLGNHQ